MRVVGRRISMQLQAGKQATAERPVDVTAERGVAGGIEVVSCDNPCFLNTGDCWGSGGRSQEKWYGLVGEFGRLAGGRVRWDDSGLNGRNGQVSVSSEATGWAMQCRVGSTVG